MKKTILSLFVAALAGISAVCAQAAETASEAVVLKVKGTATAVTPGSTTPVAVKAGDKFPQGTKIETADGASVDVQVFPGTSATIEAGTKATIEKLTITASQGVVTKQSAVIGVSVGSIISKLDPSKKAINDYSISTPKGVAAARGTQYKVVVMPGGAIRLYVKSGTVSFKNSAGQTVSVSAGFYITVGADGSLSEPTEGTYADSVSEGGRPRRGEGDTKNTINLDTTIIEVSPSSP